MKLQKKKLNISWWQGFKSYFVKNDDFRIKFKQNERAIKQIKNKLSIIYILRKFVELDKLKALILDKDQMTLFDYLPKPNILRNRQIELTHSGLLNSTGLKEKSYFEEEDVVAKSVKLLGSFHKISTKCSLSEIDQKLIDFLDEDIKNILTEHKSLIMRNKNSLLRGENKNDGLNNILKTDFKSEDNVLTVNSERIGNIDDKIRKYI